MELLPSSEERSSQHDHIDLSRNETYAKYMRMHKVLVGNQGAQQLETIYFGLKDETAPHYLAAAGSALVESALVRTDVGRDYKLGLIARAVETWSGALQIQTDLEDSAPPGTVEHGYMHRIALDLAAIPLLRGIVIGNVTEETCKKAFTDSLAIARSNMAYLEAAKARGDNEAVGNHSGVGYECNALLAFNRSLSPTWFAVPAMARSDSGYYHRKQTHDLLVIHQKYGLIRSATPVEIKSKASLRDRLRYDALLVRGRMHLSVEGKTRPEYTLAAIAAVHDSTATAEDYRIADSATRRFTDMVRDYYAGDLIGKVVGKHSATIFHDNPLVIARHPGLSKVAMVS